MIADSAKQLQGPVRSSWRRGRALWLVLPALVGVGGTVGYVRYLSHQVKETADPERTRANGMPMPVRTARVTAGQDELIIGTTGTTEASRTSIIRFGAGGAMAESTALVLAVRATEGQKVVAGHVLFEIDDTTFAQALKHCEAACAVAEGELQALRELQKEGAASGLEVKAAELKAEAAQRDRIVASRALARCRVTSPIDGFVGGNVPIVPGALIDAATELTQVLDLDPVHMRLDVPQERIGRVALGDEAEVVVDCYPQETFTGEVIRIAPQVDPTTRVLSVVLAIRNPDHRIKAGVSGFARFRVRRDVTLVPQVAITQLDRKAMVFVVKDGKAWIREVETGALVDVGMKQVVKGLAAGEEVVIYGQQDLEDGDAVNTNWKEWTGRE